MFKSKCDNKMTSFFSSYFWLLLVVLGKSLLFNSSTIANEKREREREDEKDLFKIEEKGINFSSQFTI